MNQNLNLSIVIVSFNTEKLLFECLSSLQKNSKKSSLQKEIIVIDNNSLDSSVQMIEEKFPEVILIKNNRNLGFAKANNQGIKIARGNYVLLLNSDTKVKESELKKLMDFADEQENIGVIGPRLLNSDESIQPSVFHFPTISRAIKEYWLGEKEEFEKYTPRGEQAIEVEAVVGAAMLIPKVVFDKVGLLNERYFMYFEDIDFCRRVKEAGLKVIYYPQTSVIHYHGGSGKAVDSKVGSFLIQSSKIYHGAFNYFLLTFILWSGQKFRH